MLIDSCSINLVVMVRDIFSHFLEALDELLDAVSPSLKFFLKSVNHLTFLVNNLAILIELRLKDIFLMVFIALELFDLCNFFTDNVS